MKPALQSPGSRNRSRESSGGRPQGGSQQPSPPSRSTLSPLARRPRGFPTSWRSGGKSSTQENRGDQAAKEPAAAATASAVSRTRRGGEQRAGGPEQRPGESRVWSHQPPERNPGPDGNQRRGRRARGAPPGKKGSGGRERPDGAERRGQEEGAVVHPLAREPDAGPPGTTGDLLERVAGPARVGLHPLIHRPHHGCVHGPGHPQVGPWQRVEGQPAQDDTVCDPRSRETGADAGAGEESCRPAFGRTALPPLPECGSRHRQRDADERLLELNRARAGRGDGDHPARSDPLATQDRRHRREQKAGSEHVDGEVRRGRREIRVDAEVQRRTKQERGEHVGCAKRLAQIEDADAVRGAGAGCGQEKEAVGEVLSSKVKRSDTHRCDEEVVGVVEGEERVQVAEAVDRGIERIPTHRLRVVEAVVGVEPGRDRARRDPEGEGGKAETGDSMAGTKAGKRRATFPQFGRKSRGCQRTEHDPDAAVDAEPEGPGCDQRGGRRSPQPERDRRIDALFWAGEEPGRAESEAAQRWQQDGPGQQDLDRRRDRCGQHHGIGRIPLRTK